MSNVFVPKLIATRPNLWLCCFLSECIFSYSLTDTELNITLYIDFKLHQSLTFGDFRIYSSLILYAPGPIWEVSFWFAITSRFIRGFRSPSIKYYKILMVTIRLIISQGLLFPLIVALVVESWLIGLTDAPTHISWQALISRWRSLTNTLLLHASNADIVNKTRSIDFVRARAWIVMDCRLKDGVSPALCSSRIHLGSLVKVPVVFDHIAIVLVKHPVVFVVHEIPMLYIVTWARVLLYLLRHLCEIPLTSWPKRWRRWRKSPLRLVVLRCSKWPAFVEETYLRELCCAECSVVVWWASITSCIIRPCLRLECSELDINCFWGLLWLSWCVGSSDTANRCGRCDWNRSHWHTFYFMLK